MNEIVWSQWENLIVPAGFTRLTPSTCDLESSSLEAITFYVPKYMGGKRALEYSKKMTNLKYLQMPNAGFDDALEYVRPGMVLCNARGVHDASTAELAIGLAITARRGFADFAKAQLEGKWIHKRYSSFNDSNIAIVGNGSIGKTIEKYLQPYDVTVTTFSRSGSNGSKKMLDFDALLPTFDIIFLILPLTSESHHLMNEQRLKNMKTGATLVNVARGPIVDTQALIAELNAGRISASLDVTDPEPLPDGHPLWSAKNCIISPHVGGDSDAFEPRGKKLVEEQLQRLAEGKPLANIVN